MIPHSGSLLAQIEIGVLGVRLSSVQGPKVTQRQRACEKCLFSSHPHVLIIMRPVSSSSGDQRGIVTDPGAGARDSRTIRLQSRTVHDFN